MTTSGKRFRIYNAASMGLAIRQFRQDVGLSQAELAKLTGIHRSYLSDIEQGLETQHTKRIFRILRQLGVRMTLEKTDW